MQKLLFAMLMVTQKLLHYFTDHEVEVVTSYPLEDIIRNHRRMDIQVATRAHGPRHQVYPPYRY